MLILELLRDLNECVSSYNAQSNVLAAKNLDEIPSEPFEVGACGFGCVLMKSEIFVAVFSKFGQMFTPIANCGEDIAFCWRARQCGYKILADPSIGLGHVGHTVITKEFFDNYQLTLKNNKAGRD